MEQIVKELHAAAANGSTQSLVNLLEKDPFILDRCMIISYGETPLHIAAMLGHLEFCIELLRRKPELAEELDTRRSSALHLASAKGFSEIVKVLVKVCPKMCFSVDEDGKIPIHIAAMKGKVEVLKELIYVHPDAAYTKAEMCQGETILHLCVQYSQLEALRFLVEHLNDEELLNAKDNNGNSILHLAVLDKQVQIINYLVENTKIDVFAVNSNGLTPLDILGQMPRDSKYANIFHCLQNYASSLPLETKYSSRMYQKLSESDKKKVSKLNKPTSPLEKETMWFEKQQNSLMIVASLIATMGFQATLSPPGGFWQDDKNDDQSKHVAGASIFADKDPYRYKIFMICNTVGFITSLSIILLLSSGLPITRKVFMWVMMMTMWISISSMAFTYSISVIVSLIDSQNDTVTDISKIIQQVVFGWIVLMLLLNMMHTARLVSHLMRRWSSKKRILMWTSMMILWILVTCTCTSCYFAKFPIDINEIEYIDIYINFLIVVGIGWLTSWTVVGVVILVRGVLGTTKKLMSCCRRMKEVVKSSRNRHGSISV